MKLFKYIIASICLSTSLSGCNYLDFDESTGKTKEDMYAYFDNLKSLVTYVYSQLPDDLNPLGDAMRESGTDNSVYTWSSSYIYRMYSDVWSPLKTVDDVWSSYYTVIRSAN